MLPTIDFMHLSRSQAFDRLEHYKRQLLCGANSLTADGKNNVKLSKNGKTRIFKTIMLSLLPAELAGCGTVCPWASDGCKEACLQATGKGGLDTVKLGRIARTQLWKHERSWFLEKLASEIAAAKRSADRQGLKLCARLNVLSDIAWESYGIVDDFRSVQFYDYTKGSHRVGRIRPNYWTTFSMSEVNHDICFDLLADCKNVAIPFADRKLPYVCNQVARQQLPTSWRGYEVLDGDVTDLRFLDKRGRKYGKIIGLRLKAPSNEFRQCAIDSGFAIDWR